ncbi:hypothetical protein [Streptomyces cacaoi]|uniref:hypothetical protein n=1 Tax=Streptomyces cacaoi TaxID=1898 RepID=UPI00261AD2A6|nr:hypothetical protein [Streptomyces cacaoi]
MTTFSSGDYLADESTREFAPSPWVGRVVHIYPGGTAYRAVSPTGWVWTIAGCYARLATEEETAVYEAKVTRTSQQRDALAAQLESLNRGGRR